jgi:hypothetical protein
VKDVLVWVGWKLGPQVEKQPSGRPRYSLRALVFGITVFACFFGFLHLVYQVRTKPNTSPWVLVVFPVIWFAVFSCVMAMTGWWKRGESAWLGASAFGCLVGFIAMLFAMGIFLAATL